MFLTSLFSSEKMFLILLSTFCMSPDYNRLRVSVADLFRNNMAVISHLRRYFKYGIE